MNSKFEEEENLEFLGNSCKKGGCDIKPVKKAFVILSGCVLISDSVVFDQGEGKERKALCSMIF